jgi:hypothetical protein
VLLKKKKKKKMTLRDDCSEDVVFLLTLVLNTHISFKSTIFQDTESIFCRQPIQCRLKLTWGSDLTSTRNWICFTVYPHPHVRAIRHCLTPYKAVH